MRSSRIYTEAKKIKISRMKDRSQGSKYLLSFGDRKIGGASMGVNYATSEKSAALRLFPGIVKDTDKISRIQDIGIEDDMQGYGLGQLLYLHALDNSKADWYYNSQTWEPATNTLKALAAKGLIELHWYGREPNWDQEGGVHIIRITPAGRQAYKSGSVVKKDKLCQL